MTTQIFSSVIRLAAVSVLGALFVSSASAGDGGERSASVQTETMDPHAAGLRKRHRPSLYDCQCGSYGKDWNRQLNHPLY